MPQIIKSIRARIVWTFAVLVVLNLASSYWSIYNFYSIATSVTTIIRENYQSVLAAENMMKSLERQDNALLVASEGEPPTAEGSLTENRDLFLKWTENRDLFYYWYDQAVRSAVMPGTGALAGFHPGGIHAVHAPRRLHECAHQTGGI